MRFIGKKETVPDIVMGFFGKKADESANLEVEDVTGWMVKSSVAEFVLLHTKEIKYMCLLGYTYFAGCKVFSSVAPTAPVAYKFVSLLLGSTGGGILVPIFINGIPVPLAQDAYVIAICCSFILHHYFPVLRDVMQQSPIFKVCCVVMYEIVRAYVICTLTSAAAANITPSQFSFPIFGPIMCGAVGGCGAAFLPLSKGLEPMRGGLAPSMKSALIAAACYHIFLSTNLSDGCINAEKKAHFHVSLFLMIVGLSNSFGFGVFNQPAVQMKKE